MARCAITVILALSMANLASYAESYDDDYIRIARISYMEGPVSFQNDLDVDWTAASINLPLQPGDRIYTGPGGRAEIQFDEGSVYRLAQGTDIQFLSLSEDLIQIRIMTGLSSLTVSSGTTFELDTPAAAFVVLRRGLYRFDTRDNGDTDAIVRKGELETVSHRFVRRVHSGEQVFVTADENNSYTMARYSGRDAWDEWNDRRDADFIARTSSRHLPGTVYAGVSDLDRYGRWVTVESYGAAWVPFSIGVSWSPYSVGRWCYRPVWGWTWVSYEPWGWLPYHYGRWHRSPRFGWCWLPGPSFSFNFWSPGLVTFYHGPSWVSWCPLGPGDYYSINNYHYNRRLYRHHLADLGRLHWRAAGHSVNRQVRGAFRSMEIDHFRNGGSRTIATREGYRQIEQPWSRGTLVRERLAVRPTSKSFSPDPDRSALRSKLINPRPALVHNDPQARAAGRGGYVRVTNPEVASRAVARLRSGDTQGIRNRDTKETAERTRGTQGADYAGRESDEGRMRILRSTPSKSSGAEPARSAGGAAADGPPGRADVRSPAEKNRAGDNQQNRQNQDINNSNPGRTSGSANRADSSNFPVGRSDRSATTRSAVPRNSSGIVSGGTSGTRREEEKREPVSPPVRRIQPTPQKSGSAVEESVRTNRSDGRPRISQSARSSAPGPSYSTPSPDSRSRSDSVPSSGIRTRSYSSPSAGSQSRSYAAPSPDSRSRSYSTPSRSIGSRSNSSPSSARSSSADSPHSRSSGQSSNSSKSNSSPRKARSR
ncbi:MAG: FecR domain-containing protein [Acidobacteria bacterium]|nr:FecR domain-containing protein [Acidobacteriota bacterium]